MAHLKTKGQRENMNLLRLKLSSLLGKLTQGRSQPADLRLRISNVTRRTLLADCLEVADKGPRRRKGLLGRKGLSSGEGLWIVPCEAVHTFGMQFPIDLVYLDRKHRIIKTRSHVRPGRLSACLSAHSVIELPAGTVRVTQTMPGDTLAFLDIAAGQMEN
jgi:uncharacterized membrane protein (UPF0127 family)